MAPKVTVVVCTFNRANILGHCLDSLHNQTLESRQFEVVIVDNNSTDNTVEVVQPYLHHSNFRYCRETVQGLSAARNRGMAEARSPYIAYIDDDAVAVPEYLDVACGIFATLRPAPCCLGGPILPFYTSKKPDWFKDEYETRRLRSNPYFLTEGESFSGSNMIWALPILKELNGFALGFGMSGTRLALGEDTEIFRRIWEMYKQPRLYYAPQLVIKHAVPKNKMTVRYQLARQFLGGQFKSQIDSVSNSGHRFRYVRVRATLLARRIFHAIAKAPKYSTWRNWAVEELGPAALYLGELIAAFGIKVNAER